MERMQHIPLKGPSSPPSDDLKAVLEVVRSQVAQEFQIAERLDSKARNQVALAGTWYALAQAIAGVAFREHAASSAWTVLIGSFAAIAAVALGVTMYHSSRVWSLRRERDFAVDSIREMVQDAEAD